MYIIYVDIIHKFNSPILDVNVIYIRRLNSNSPRGNFLRAHSVRRCFAASKQIKRSFYRTQCYRVFDNHLYKSENMISSVYSYITSSSRHRVYIHFRRPIFSLGNKFECLSFVRTYVH